MKTILALEDNRFEKEDDRNVSPTLHDDQDGLVTLQELLDSKREEAGHHKPSLSSLSLIESGDQSKGEPSQVKEVTSNDTLQDSSLVRSMLGPTAQHRGEYENDSSMEDPHFVGNSWFMKFY